VIDGGPVGHKAAHADRWFSEGNVGIGVGLRDLDSAAFIVIPRA
jgi:hypothetical protein